MGKATSKTMVEDPVCGMMVDSSKGKPTASHEGKTYHFCSEDCREMFEHDPEEYTFREDEPED